MNKYYSVGFFLFNILIQGQLFSQKVTFTIEGRIPKPVKSIMWLTEPTFSTITDSIIGLQIDSEISSNDAENPFFKFRGSISGNKKVPLQLVFIIDGEDHVYYSDIFLVSTGDIELIVSIDSIKKKIILNNVGNALAFDELNKLLKNYSFEDSIQQNVHELRSIADSFNSLNAEAVEWLLAMIYSRQGYSSLLIPLLNKLDCKAATYNLCTYLYDKIHSASFLNINSLFPFREIKFGSQLQDIIVKSKFTLVEFWATWCTPCIALLPEWKQLIKSYEPSKIQVFGVALESSKKPNALKKFLSINPNPWIDFIDWDGKESDNLNIRQIPSNILLNRTGEIVALNVSASELKILLDIEVGNIKSNGRF